MHLKSDNAMSRMVLKVLRILAIIAIVRASMHIIRLIILATLGLGGLVLYQAVMSGKPISHLQTAIGKRSISEFNHLTPSVQLALKLDDRECARQYVCELAAAQQRMASIFPDNMRILNQQDAIALGTFQAAARTGLELKHFETCHQVFTKCPYQNIGEMQTIIEKYTNM